MVKLDNPEDYEFLRFEVNDKGTQKYKAILFNKQTNNEVAVKFGHKKYQQYKDSTGLGAYSHLDHNDETRRKSYRKRHAKEKDAKYSCGGTLLFPKTNISLLLCLI